MTYPFPVGKARADAVNDAIAFGHPLFARKTVIETVNNSSTYQSDNELFVTVSANAIYVGTLSIMYAASTVADFKLQLTLPSGASTPNWIYVDATPIINNWSPTTGLGVLGEGAAVISGFFATGVVVVGSTAGNVQMQWAQNTAEATDTSVIVGSYIMLTRVA